MKRSKTLRLHRQHDLDLITLYRSTEFQFSKELRNILVAYVSGETYTPPTINFDNVDLSYIPTTIQYHLTLNDSDEKERAVLDMLQHEIKYGYVNSFIKALIRAYVPFIPFIGYGVNNGFVTRRINATDVGMAIRTAAKEENKKVKADAMDISDILTETNTKVVSETPETHQNKTPNTEDASMNESNAEEDAFDDFFNMAQAFTHA